jgi:hypothetical protein
MLTASVKLWFALAAISLPMVGSGQDAAPLSLQEAVKMTLASWVKWGENEAWKMAVRC